MGMPRTVGGAAAACADYPQGPTGSSGRAQLAADAAALEVLPESLEDEVFDDEESELEDELLAEADSVVLVEPRLSLR